MVAQKRFEYAVVYRAPTTDTILFRSWSHRACVQWIADGTDNVDQYLIARRHCHSLLWRTDWQDS